MFVLLSNGATFTLCDFVLTFLFIGLCPNINLNGALKELEMYNDFCQIKTKFPKLGRNEVCQIYRPILLLINVHNYWALRRSAGWIINKFNYRNKPTFDYEWRTFQYPKFIDGANFRLTFQLALYKQLIPGQKSPMSKHCHPKIVQNHLFTPDR